MKCRNINRELLDYADGKLDETRRLVVENHMTSCKSCQEFTDKLRESLKTIEEEKSVEFDPYMFTRTMATIDTMERRNHLIVKRRIWQPAMVAVFLFLIVLAGIHIGRDYKYQQAMTNDYATEVFFLNDIHNNSYEALLVTE